MIKFKEHYTSVLIICSSILYAFIMKLLFKFRQKNRKEL